MEKLEKMTKLPDYVMIQHWPMKIPISSSTTTPQIVFLLKNIMAVPVVTKSTPCVEHKTQTTLLTRAATGPNLGADESNPRLLTLE